MNCIRTLLLIIVLSISLPLWCQGIQQPLVYSGYYAEGSKQLTIGQVMQQWQHGHFDTLKNTSVNFGRTDQRYWFRFQLAPSALPQILTLSNAFLYEVTLYGITNNHPKMLYQTGINYPFAQRPLFYRHFALPLQNDTTRSEYYLLVDRRNELMRCSFRFLTSGAFNRYQISDALFFGLFFGVLLFITLGSSVLWIATKEHIYLYYLGYILVMLLFIAADNGYGYQWLWSDAPLVQKYIRNFLSLAAVAIQLPFMQLFLGQPKNSAYAGYTRKTIWLCLLLLPVMALGCWMDTQGMTMPKAFVFPIQFLFYTVFIAAISLVLVNTYQAIRKQNRIGSIYLLAMLPLVMQMIVVILSRWHIITLDVDTALLFALAILLEIVTLGMGMIFRVNRTRKEKAALAQLLAQQQQTTIKKVLEAQEEERTRIAQDLHDQMGGTLSSVRGLLSSLPLSLLTEHSRLQKAQEILEDACNDLRTIAHNLMPLHLEKTSLAEVLQESVAKANFNGKTRFQFVTFGAPRQLDRDTIIGLIRIATELMQNVIRHSRATEATLQLLWHPEMTELMIEDNGVGFDPKLFEQKTLSGIGLKSIFARADYINAAVRYDATPHGTTVICTIPTSSHDHTHS